MKRKSLRKAENKLKEYKIIENSKKSAKKYVMQKATRY